MPAQIRLLESDGITPLTSVNFGNILAGAQSVPKLFFMNAYGDAPCNSSEFGVEAIAGNDGFQFAQIAAASVIDNSATLITPVVEVSGGSIAAGADITYKVAVQDRWGKETPLNGAGASPSIAGGTTNRVALSWSAVEGAFKYVIYSSISGGAYYKVGEATTNAYVDSTGLNDGITAATGSAAYKFTSWGAGPVTTGDIPVGGKVAVGLRQAVPLGTSITGNPRQHRIYVSFVTT